MSNQANGTATEMNRDWVIARDDGLWLVGRIAHDPEGLKPGDGLPLRLEPVFELTVQVQPQIDPRTRQPVGININDHAQPLLLMGALANSWKLSSGANTWPVRGLGSTREKSVRTAIDRAEDMVRQMRAQEAGLVLVSDMPKIGRVQ